MNPAVLKGLLAAGSGAGPTPAPWDVSAANYVQSFSVGGSEGVFFKPDGTKMYFADNPRGNESIKEYNLSTAWNVSSASYVQDFDVTGQSGNPTGVFFKPDGTRMFVTDSTTDEVYQYHLSTPWSVASAFYVTSFDTGSQVVFPEDVYISPDGTKMYVVDDPRGNESIKEYNINSWNVASAFFIRSEAISSQEIAPRGVFFKPDGTKMYVVGSSGDDVNEYDLSTAWNISTAVFLQSFSVAAQSTFPTGVHFDPEGIKMYVVDSSAVHEYDLFS